MKFPERVLAAQVSIMKHTFCQNMGFAMLDHHHHKVRRRNHDTPEYYYRVRRQDPESAPRLRRQYYGTPAPPRSEGSHAGAKAPEHSSSGGGNCATIDDLDAPESIQFMKGNTVQRHVQLKSVNGEGSSMTKASKGMGKKQDCSVQFTFTRPVAIKDIQLCSFNPQFTGSRIGVKSIMVEVDNNGEWTFIKDKTGQKKVFPLTNNHTAIDLPFTKLVRLYPYEWDYRRPHIYKPRFKGC